MPMNRVQFQPSLSIREFQAQFGTQEQCEHFIEKWRWPRGYVCPRCESQSHCVVWHGKVKTFQCNRCRSQVTLTSGTIFHATKLPLVVWLQAMYLMAQTKNGISAMELMRMLGVCYRTAWRLKHKLMQVMREREEKTVLDGRVELDDAYLGGVRTGGKSGRGSENKVPFVAAIETDQQGHPLRALLSPVAAFSREQISAWAQKGLRSSSVVVSDGLDCFQAVSDLGCRHLPKVVGKDRKSSEIPCFHWVNTLLSNVKTSLSGTYHAFDFEKYAGRYLAEIQYRFNRRFNLKSLLSRLFVAAVQTGHRKETWLRQAEA